MNIYSNSTEPLRKARVLNWSIWKLTILAIAFSVMGPGYTTGQTTNNWIGSGQSEEQFTIPGNWILNQVPGPNHIAQFSFSYAFPITINFDDDVNVDELQILASEFIYRSTDATSAQPTVVETNRVEIEGDAKLTMIHGPNDRSLLLRADRLDLDGEMNITQGTSVEIDTAIIDSNVEEDPVILRVVGDNDGLPSTLQSEEIVVGSDFFGRVEIVSGAVVNVSGDTELGQFGGHGELAIDGTNNPFQASFLSTNNYIGSADTMTTITGRSQLIVNNILLTQETNNRPGVVEVSTPQASVQIGNELRLDGGNFSLINGATLMTNKVTAQQVGEGFGFTMTQLNLQSTAASTPAFWLNTNDVYVGGSATFPNNYGGGIEIDGGIAKIDGTFSMWEEGRFKISETGDAKSHLIVDSIDNSRQGQFDVDGGTISVNEYIGNFDQPGGRFAPGDDVLGSLPGSSIIAGNYFQFPGSVLAMDINGSAPVDEHDIVEVGGFMLLGGQLELTKSNNYQPNASDEIILVSAANIIGSFENVESGYRLTTTDGNGSFRVDYGFASPFNAGQIIISDYQEGSFLLGDVNRDGAVNLLDVVPFIDLITSNTFMAEADINGDGNVDLLDVDPFVELLSN